MTFLNSASTLPGSYSSSRELVLREHNLGSPGTQSLFSMNTILVLWEPNLSSLGTQYQFSGKTVSVLQGSNIGFNKETELNRLQYYLYMTEQCLNKVIFNF